MTLSSWIVLPLISAFIGYITNYIAVKMIFRPLKPKRFLGVTILGLIPRRQAEIARKLGEVFERNLVSHKDVEQVLKSSDLSSEAADFLTDQVDLFAQKFAQKNPMVGMFLQGEVLTQVKAALVEQMKEVLPQFMGKIASKVGDTLSFKEIIRQKIEEFDAGRVEQLIYEISARELKAIEILGGVLGFIIGLGQVAILSL